MSKYPPLSDRNFQTMRQEAKAMVDKPNFSLSKTKETVAVYHGFENWRQVELANQEFKRVSQRYLEKPVFFWDVKEEVGFNIESLGPSWLFDSDAREFCHELLWKKPRINLCYEGRKEWLDGVLYTGKWSSFEELDYAALASPIRPPEYVFIEGCFIPFEELREGPKYPGELEKAETNLVIYDEVEPLLDRLHSNMSAAVLDFSNQFYWDLGQTSLFNSYGWTPKEAGDFVQDLYIEQAILVSPSDEVVTSVKRRLGDHLVQVVDLSF